MQVDVLIFFSWILINILLSPTLVHPVVENTVVENRTSTYVEEGPQRLVCVCFQGWSYMFNGYMYNIRNGPSAQMALHIFIFWDASQKFGENILRIFTRIIYTLTLFVNCSLPPGRKGTSQ